MAKGVRWCVRLGREEWLRFTYDRLPGDALTLLGSVSHGARIGALAVDADGQYAQVNGDFVCPLNTNQIRKAVSAAERLQRTLRPKMGTRTTQAPVVVVKRKRVLALPVRAG